MRSVFVPCLFLLTLFSQAALAQYAHRPFFDHTEALGASHGIEMLDMRLGGLTFADPDELNEFGEQIEGAFARDLPRFLPGLAARDPELAEALREVMEEIEELVETGRGEEVAAAAQRGRELLAAARSRMMTPELLQMPDFTAALMTTLLLAEEGVAERFEETVAGEEAAFPGGWVGQQRVKELWAELEPLATDDQRFEITEMLAELDRLFPTPELPRPEALTDAEAGEDPAQRIVGFLEELADASLYPDRDLGEMIVLTRDLVGSGCDALEAGDESRAEQQLAIAGFYYAQYVGGTVRLLAPELDESLEPLWFAFSEESEGESGDEESTGEDEIDCRQLLDDLEQVRNLFGV